jgi:hypothetical protein
MAGMRFGIPVAVSIVVGLFLMVPLAMLFDAMNWPLFHSWGLAHGSFVIAWPLLALACFVMILGIRRATRKPRESSDSN